MMTSSIFKKFLKKFFLGISKMALKKIPQKNVYKIQDVVHNCLIKKFLDKLSETLEIPCFYYGNILAAVGRLAAFGHEKIDFKFGLFLKSFHLILLFLYLTFYFLSEFNLF